MGQIKNIKLHIVTDIKNHSSDHSNSINMFSKIVKANGEQPDELEKSIGEALLDLEVNSDLKNQLRELYITSAKELEIGDKKRCIIIFVPVPLLRSFNKIQVRLVRELEKKSSQTHTEDTEPEADETSKSYLDCCARFHPGGSCLPFGDCWQEDSSEVGCQQDHQGDPGEGSTNER